MFILGFCLFASLFWFVLFIVCFILFLVVFLFFCFLFVFGLFVVVFVFVSTVIFYQTMNWYGRRTGRFTRVCCSQQGGLVEVGGHLESSHPGPNPAFRLQLFPLWVSQWLGNWWRYGVSAMARFCVRWPGEWHVWSSAQLPPRWPSGKAFASRAEDPGFESRLRRDFFGVESYQWLKNWHSSGYPARRLVS